MQGFQAKTVAAVRSQRVVCVVKVSELRAKAFQVGFDKDGSLFIHFPYFQHRTGILSSSKIPATGERKAKKGEIGLHSGTTHRSLHVFQKLDGRWQAVANAQLPIAQ
jgi:hypothetical protein